MMAGGNGGLQRLSTRMVTTGRRDGTIKSTMDSMAQATERMSLKIDNQSLTNDTYRRQT